MNAPDQIAPPAVGSPQRAELRIAFAGSGAEYFRIWAVNLLLSVVTLGIYSAWAKVRRERYFLNNTVLDGSPFDYHADPVRILKGRIVVAVVVSGLAIASHLNPVVSAVASLLFLVLMPWMISRALRFRAHNTSWRGLRFGFDGTAGQAATAWLLWPTLVPLSLGLLFPQMIVAQWRYLLEHLRFGQAGFGLEARVGPIYRAMAAAGLCFALIAGIGIAASGLATAGLADAVAGRPNGHQVVAALGGLMTIASVVLAATLVGPYLRVRLANLLARCALLGNHRFRADQRVLGYYRIVLTNWLLTLLTLGLFRPFALVRLWRYRVEHFAVLAEGDAEAFVAAQAADARVLGSEAADLMDLDFGL